MTTLVDVDPIVDHLDSVHLETGHDCGKVFQDWMALAVAAFAADDPRYNDVLDVYPVDGRDDPDDEIRRACAEDFANALGELVARTAEANQPILGGVYEEIGRQSDALGQHFTPWTVSLLKAQLTIHATDVEAATADDPLSISDPACGSGRLLVAAAKTVHDQDPSAPLFVAGVDKDRTCARMAVVNLVIAQVPGRIWHGNSLTCEMWRRWDVHPHGPGPAVSIVEDPADWAPPSATADDAGDGADAEEQEEEATDDPTPEPAITADVDVDLGEQTDLLGEGWSDD